MLKIVVTVVLLFFVTGACMAEPIELPDPDRTSGVPLMEAFANRRSMRNFCDRPLDKQVLSELLWAANGINRESESKRTVPTARNWQQIDLYVIMPEGFYYYDAQNHQLVKKGDEDLRDAAGRQPFTGEAPLNLVFVADHAKMEGADEEALIFYSATDTGFVSQNVYLYAASSGLNTVVLGLVDKEMLAEKMGLREDQKIVLSQTVGYPPE